MRLNRQHFNRHVVKMGQKVRWSAAYRCSCINRDTGSPDPTCKLCHKRGYIYDPAVDTVVGGQGQKTQEHWEKSGLYEDGDIVITVPENSPMWDGGHFDRVVMLNTSERFSTTLTRGAPGETLKLFDIIRLERVFWKNRDGELVEGGIPAVADDGSLSWADHEPPPGTTYSVTGFRYTEYYMFQEYPSNRNFHQGVRLPKRVVLRRWDLAGRIA